MRLPLALAAAFLAAAPAPGQSWGAGGCPAPAPLPVRQPAPWAEYKAPDCCVKVVATRPDGSSGCGSGTVLVRPPGESDRVLTARHVAEGGGRLEVVCGSRTLPATVVALCAESDLALLGVAEPLPYALVADRPAGHGDPVRTWGFGGGRGCKPTAGVATGPESAASPTQPGDSGAGVFDRDGKLVGVHVAGNSYRGPGTAGYRVPLAAVKKFLAEAMPEPKKKAGKCPCPDGGCDCYPCKCGPKGDESCPCGGKCRPCEAAPPPRKAQQYPPGGVSRDEMRPTGKDRFSVCGVPCEVEAFRAAMAGAGPQLVDDSKYPYVYVIGSEADRDRVFKDFADDFALVYLKVRLKGYPPGHPQVRDYPPGLIHLQAPNGRPLKSWASYDGPAKLAADLKTAIDAYDPAKDPGVGKPYPKPTPPAPPAPPPPKPDPKPDDKPAAPDAPPAPAGPAQVPAWVYAALALAALYLLTRKGSDK
jgi:hypothetical protein